MILLLLLPLLGGVQETGDPPTREEGSAARASARAIKAAEELRSALAAWRRAVEAGATMDRATVERFRRLLQGSEADVRRIYAASDQVADGPAPLANAANAATRRRAYEIAGKWIEAVRAVDETAEVRRQGTFDALRRALADTDETRRWAALIALAQMGDLNYDKAAFRTAIVPLLPTLRGGQLVSAFYALHGTVPQERDLELLFEAWERRTPGLERAMTHLLSLFSEGEFMGRSEEILLNLLDRPDRAVRREALRGVWGASLSERASGRLIELLDEPDSRQDTLYFGLSTLRVKNGPVVGALLGLLKSENAEEVRRAVWGLGSGIPAAYHRQVAVALIDVHNGTSDASLRADAARIVRLYGTDEELARLVQ